MPPLAHYKRAYSFTSHFFCGSSSSNVRVMLWRRLLRSPLPLSSCCSFASSSFFSAKSSSSLPLT